MKNPWMATLEGPLLVRNKSAEANRKTGLQTGKHTSKGKLLKSLAENKIWGNQTGAISRAHQIKDKLLKELMEANWCWRVLRAIAPSREKLIYHSSFTKLFMLDMLRETR